MLTRFRHLAMLGLIALPLGLLAACDEPGPAEEAGRAIDETMEEAGQAIEDAGEELQDAVD